MVIVDKVARFVMQDRSWNVGPAPLLLHLLQDQGQLMLDKFSNFGTIVQLRALLNEDHQLQATSCENWRPWRNVAHFFLGLRSCWGPKVDTLPPRLL